MKTCIVFVLFVIFVIQIDKITSQSKDDQKKEIKSRLQTDDDFKQLSPIAQNTVSTMLNHIVRMVRNENSAKALKEIALSFETVLTSEYGQKNVMNILDLIGFVLRDKNASAIISLLCEQATVLITTSSGREALKRTVVNTYKVMELPSVVPAAESFLTNFNRYLTSVSEAELAGGLALMKRAVNTFGSNAPAA